jgi:hypothetical protein
VYTRLVFKGAYVLSRSHEYEREWEVLSELLDQKLYRRGRRGEWWERRALIEERYMWQNDHSMLKPQVKKKWLKKSLETCELALQDSDTHVIFHPWLQKRLLRIERGLGIPKAQQHTFAHVALRPPTVREFVGVRLDDRDIGKKSTWRSTRDPAKDISVEELCLEQYEDQGWKGFHSENGIVTTIVYPYDTGTKSSLRCCFGIYYFFHYQGYLKLRIRLRRSISLPMHFSLLEEVRSTYGSPKLKTATLPKSYDALTKEKRDEKHGV